MRRVVITGMGAITPLGNSVEAFWNGIKEKKTGFGPITKFDTSAYKCRLAAEVKEHSAAAYWKSLGYYDTSIGMTEKQITIGISTTKEKIRDVSSKAAGLADDLTWGVLYQAVKLEQAAEFWEVVRPR